MAQRQTTPPLSLTKQAVKSMTRPQILICGPRVPEKDGFRHMASAGNVYTFTVPGIVPQPQKHMEDYITSDGAYLTGEGGRPHSENAGMVNDWHGWTDFMDTVLHNETVKDLFDFIFSEDYFLLPERGYVRNALPKKDLNCPLEALAPHVDYPAWKRCPDTELKIYSVPCLASKITFIVFDQADVHGVAQAGDCAGWFVSVVNRANHTRYLNQLDKLLTRLRAGKLKSGHHDPLILDQPEPVSAKECLKLYLVMGSRPHLYSSGKTVQGPHSMAARAFPVRSHRYLSAEAFKKIRRKPKVNMLTVVENLKQRGLYEKFKQTLSIAPQWNVDPTQYSNLFLHKTVLA